MSDLDDLERIEELLVLLGDPFTSASTISRLVDCIPVLAARLRAGFPLWARHVDTTKPGIAYIGNRLVEREVLRLLDDLTALQAEIDGEVPSLAA